MLATGWVDPGERNRQFEFIETRRAEFKFGGSPVLSVDTKKKEFLGGLFREGALYSYEGKPLKRFDHDFPHLAEGRVVPHGIHDLHKNSGFMTLGTSMETPRFVAACLKRWWFHRGRFDYPETGSVYVLLDNGGANGSRSHQFKLEMLQLAAQTNLTWHVSHYPPYCSKWNPIEHRLFPHVTRAIQGVCLDSVETMREMIERKTTTSTGLESRAYIMEREFRHGQKTLEALPDGYPLVGCAVLPKWNYTCYPFEVYSNLTYLN